MNKKQFIKIISEIVRREVKKEVNRIFIKEEKQSINLSDSVTIQKEEPQKKEKKLVNDPILNKILNETKGGIPQGEDAPYPTIGGGTYDTSRMGELVARTMGREVESNEVARNMNAVETIKSKGVNPDSVPEDVVNAMTRDYSALMKAMDKK